MTRVEQHDSGVIQWLTAAERRALLCAFLAGLMARAGALFYTASPDDFVFLTHPDAGRLAFNILVANGRFAGGAILAGLSWLGLGQPHANVLGVVLGTFALSLTGIIACRVWRLPGGAVPATIVTCLISIHPYHADIATYRVTFLVVSMAFLTAASAAFLLLETRVPLAVPAVTLALGCAMYQVSFTYALIILVGAWLTGWWGAHEDLRGAAILQRAGIAVLSSVPLYFLMSVAALKVSNLAPDARVATIALNEFGKRSSEILGLIRKLALDAEPIVPMSVKAMLLGLLAAAILALVVRQGSEKGVLRGLLTGVTGLVLAAAMSLLVVAHLFVVVEWWPAPRTLSQIGVFWGMVFAAGYKACGAHQRRVLLCLGGLLVASFVGLANQVFFDEHRMNTRDTLRSGRIVARLEARPDFASVKALAIIGGEWNYPLPTPSTYYDLNISALYAPWSRVVAINDVSGYNFAVVSDGKRLEAARSYCAAAAPWPAEASITVQGEVGVVCLGKP